MENNLQKLLTEVITTNKIVIKNQVALEDRFNEMCVDLSKALGSISTTMRSMSRDPIPEQEEEINESGKITYL